MAKLGYVGLGTMGGRVALRLLKAGHQVRGYNRTPERARWLVDEGLTSARRRARSRRVPTSSSPWSLIRRH